MLQKIAITIVMIVLYTGCVPNDLSITPDKKTTTKKDKNLWADDTNIDDVTKSDNNSIDNSIDESGDKKPIKRIPFPQSEYHYLAKIGKGTIKGKIYLIDTYEQAILGKNTRLYLNPITSYSKQWYKESYLSRRKMESADKRLFNYLKFTSSNKNGIFAFYGVPSGRYYLVGTVACKEECGYDESVNIRLATEITIRPNQVVNRDLSKKVE